MQLNLILFPLNIYPFKKSNWKKNHVQIQIILLFPHKIQVALSSMEDKHEDTCISIS